MGSTKNRPERMMAAEPPERQEPLPTVQVRRLVAYNPPVSTCPRCARRFRAESRTRVECPFCRYRLLGGL